MKSEDYAHLIEFYQANHKPEDILNYPWPEHSLEIDESSFKQTLAHTPILTLPEKKMIIEQLPFFTQSEFDQLMQEIHQGHAKIKKSLAKLKSKNPDFYQTNQDVFVEIEKNL